MAVRITGTAPQGAVNRTGNRASKKTDAAESGSVDKKETVALSDTESSVSLVKEASKGVPDVDMAKVAQLRAAISDGSYSADLKTVAERIIREAALFG